MRENFLIWLSNKLPKSLVKWCFVRVTVNGTVGKYSNQILPELTCTEALKRFYE